MASIEDFVQDPSDTLLDEFTKDQLLELAKHYNITVISSKSKGAVKSVVRAALVETCILQDVKADPVSTGVSTALPSKELSFEQQKELLELQLQRDKWAAEVAIEKLKVQQRMEQEKLEQQKLLEQERLKVETYRLDLIKEGKITGDVARPVSPGPHMFSFGSSDISHSLRLCPKFNESDPDSFFLVFERVAEIRNWTDADRTLLLQCVLTGKGQEAVSALSSTQCRDYATVKDAVLKAYELIPEAYRQRFRTMRKKDEQNNVEFARELGTQFNRWCAAAHVVTLEDLRELILLEQFKNTLHERVATHLTDQNVKTIAAGAVKADEYVLNHNKGLFGERARGGGSFGTRQQDPTFSRPNRQPDSLSKPNRQFKGSEGESVASRGKVDGRLCHYCLQAGHWKNDCPRLKAKAKIQSGSRNIKPALMATSVSDVRAVVIAAVRDFTKPTAVAAQLPSHAMEVQAQPEPRSEADPGYQKYITEGHVSLVGSGVQVPVRILRDSGALDSFISESVFPFSQESDTGEVC